MRHAITLQRLHGETAFQVTAGPEVAINEQLDAAKAIARTGREHAEIAELQVWTSSEGLRKRYRFKSSGVQAQQQPAPPQVETPHETTSTTPADPKPEKKSKPAKR